MKGNPVEFTYYVDLDETNTEEIADLQLVCFAQNSSSKEIYQSASFEDLAYGEVLPMETFVITIESVPVSHGQTYRVFKGVDPTEYLFSVPAYMTLENRTDSNLVIGTRIQPVGTMPEGYGLQFCGFMQCYDYTNIPNHTLDPGRIVGLDPANDPLDVQYNVPFEHAYGEPFEPLLVEVSFFDCTNQESISFFIDFVPVWCNDSTEKLLPIDSVHFPDSVFRGYIAARADIFHDGFLSERERDGLQDVNISDMGIGSLRGIEYFTSLDFLDCSNNQLTDLDLRMNTQLSSLDCSNNQLTDLDLRMNTQLSSLDCSSNRLTDLDLRMNTQLETLNCSSNQLVSIDVRPCIDLLSLDCSNNRLYSLDLSNNSVLQTLEADGNCLHVAVDGRNRFDASTLSGFDLARASDWKGCTRIGYLLTFQGREVSYRYETGYHGPALLPEIRFTLIADIQDSLLAIDVANFPDSAFRTYVSRYADLNTDGFLNLSEIAGVTGVDVSSLGIRNLKGIEHFTSLESLDCSDNQLASLDLSLNTKLTELDATGNVLAVSLDDANRLELSALPGFDPAKASDWTGAQVENGQLQFLQAEVSYAYETGYQGEAELPEVRFHLDAGNGEAEIALSEANFPDAVFRIHVGGQIDRSGNDSLDIVERGNVRVLEVPSMGIQDLRGIGYFNKLENLDCSGNELTSLDLSGNPELQTLNAENNRLDITLDASNGFDLSLLPGFDLAKASGWEGGTRLGNILTFSQREVTYAYATGYNGSTEDESLSSVRFSLRADRDPGVANESMATKPQGKVYAKEHVIYIEGIEGEISVFTPSGMLLYQGHGKEIPVRNDGLYIVRSGQQVWKVLVM